MSEQQPSKRNLSEISHLFLSSVREKQGGGSSPPQRTGPNGHDQTIPLTAEEFAQVYGSPSSAAEPRRRAVPVTAVIAGHLNGRQLEFVKQYARHLASSTGRVGLIELEASEMRLMCFEPAAPPSGADADPASCQCAEPRQIAEALEEMNWDVERWLLLLPNPRTPEARELLRRARHWVLLSTCDHDGVVSSYRMLKGLADGERPRLGLSLLDAGDEAQAIRVFNKLFGVCHQFLDWPLEQESAVESAPAISEHLVLEYRPTHDKAQLAAGAQWTMVSEFLDAARLAEIATTDPPVDPMEPQPRQPAPQHPRHAVVDLASDRPQEAPVPAPEPAIDTNYVIPLPRPSQQPNPAACNNGFDEVIDLPEGDVSAASILDAVLRNTGSGLVECPIRPPACPQAKLAVDRSRGIVLLAAASQGLSDLRSIGQAYRWLNENRELIAMAVPQFAIDPGRLPRLRLLVDRADLSADILQPMLQSDHVSVQAYRKLRWGRKLGVFLEAA